LMSQGSDKPPERAMLGEPLIFAPRSCDAAVIWLHGFGDAPENWASTLRPLRSSWSASRRWKWLHPRAPLLPQPCFDGVLMPGWAPLSKTSCLSPADAEDTRFAAFLDSSVAAVKSEIEQLEKDGLLPEQILLGGFAQGAAVALQTVLSMGRAFAGCIVLSGWLTPTARKQLETEKISDTPILLCHGTADELVSFDCALSCKKALDIAGVQVQFEEYPGLNHEVCPQELALLASFLHLQLAPEAEAPAIDWKDVGSDSDAMENDGEDSDCNDHAEEVTYVCKEALETLRHQIETGSALSLASLQCLEDIDDLPDDAALVAIPRDLVGTVMEMLGFEDTDAAAKRFLQGAAAALQAAEAEEPVTAQEWRDYLKSSDSDEEGAEVKVQAAIAEESSPVAKRMKC